MAVSPYLVDVHWLSQCLSNSNAVVIDARFSLADSELGYQQYRLGHILGAYYLHLNRDLSSPVQSHGGRHPLPDWAQFARTLNQMGVFSKPPNGPTQIVIYDDSRFAFAARLWWMLRYLGHEQVAILDGGIKAWESADLPISTDIPGAIAGNFIPQPQSDWIVDIDAVRQAVRQRKDRSGAIVIDSRSPERFRGEVEPIDPIAGSIPGAINSFWKNVTTEAGYMKNTSALSSQWSSLASKDEIIVYCGSGVTACVNLFSLVVAGHPMYKLYPGGWSDWCSYEDIDKA